MKQTVALTTRRLWPVGADLREIPKYDHAFLRILDAVVPSSSPKSGPNIILEQNDPKRVHFCGHFCGNFRVKF